MIMLCVRDLIKGSEDGIYIGRLGRYVMVVYRFLEGIIKVIELVKKIRYFDCGDLCKEGASST